MTPLVHFICGSTGAGKTTYARELAAEIGGVRFAVDEWMSALFWPDSPQPIDPAWAMERVGRVVDRIWRTAADVARAGTPVLLEIGLTTRADRARFAALACEAGLSLRLHWLDVPPEERWARVKARNRQAGPDAQLDFAVDRAMFDYVEGLWEAPDVGELAAMDGLRITGTAPRG